MDESVDGVAGQRRMRVLAAEDNPIFRSMLLSMLTKWGYDVVVARDGNEASRILNAESAPRLAILDWMMPGADGPEICRRVRAEGCEPYIYILLLTARSESQDLVDGMDSGADDYVTKPFNTHELRVRLRAGRRIVDLQEELMQAREALRQQATYDGLTGLLNRTAVLNLVESEAERASREGRPISVLLADLDRFKAINDTYGHVAGDAVLREAARRMQSVIRRYDGVGRYGGEEFLAVLPGSGGEAAWLQAERIRQAVASEPFAIGEAAITVTCSIGVAYSPDPSPAQVDALVRDADLALYMAKDHGRNRVETC